MNNKTERDSISVLCEGFTKALKDALLTKKIGEKIVSAKSGAGKTEQFSHSVVSDSATP